MASGDCRNIQPFSRRALLSVGGVLGSIAIFLPLGGAFCQTTRFVRIEEFGGAAKAGFDNTAPLRRAMETLSGSGGTVLLGPGEYQFASSTLLRQGAIKRPSGVTLQGAGASHTTVRIIGSSVINQLFDASGSSQVFTRQITFIGNGVKAENAPYAGALMVAKLPASAQSDMSEIFLQDCLVDNFGSATWVLFENDCPVHSIRHVGSTGCKWISRPGNAPGAGDIGVPGHFIYLYGYRGPIEQVLIDDVSMDAAYIKGGVAMIGDINGGRVSVSSISNAGQFVANVGATPDGPGAYAVVLYRKPSGEPRNLEVSIDRLDNVYSVGIYSAGAHSNRYHIGSAWGQRDTRDATLYKGILAIQGGHAIDAQIDSVTDSLRVLMISIDGGQRLGATAGNAGISVNLADVRSTRGAHDITIGAGGSPRAGGVRITGERSGPAEVGVDLRAARGTILQDIDLGSLSSSGAMHPIQIGSAAGQIIRVTMPR
jgi:hypothetical protein